MELESLDKLLKQRRATRTSFTKIAKQVSDLIEVENVNIVEVQSLCSLLERKIAILNELDAKVLNLLLDDDEADIDKEIEGADEYQKKYLDLKLCISGIQVQQTEYEADSVNSRTNNQQTKTFKLPKLEFRTFGGDLKEWLPFWSQFSKIHEDPEIAVEDKFQYLIQATVKGSRARQVVESFPPTRINYGKAIESLKSRFGQEDLLVEVYVRELLRLVLHKASESKPRIALSQLYDQLETQLRSLESLGVTTDKCASMLFPLVESCLPEDLLRIWQRSTPFTSAENAKDRLEGLMKFLKSEVEGEERINLASSGFDLKGDRTKEKMKHKGKDSDDNIPTAMGLLTSNQRKDDKCVFCEGHHSSVDCFSARKMSMESKQKLLKEKGCCYMCLKSGHMIKTCKAKNIKCIICGGKHVVLMCRQLLEKQLSVSKEASNSEVNIAQEVSLANVSSVPKVLLQTLRVNIRSDSKTECVRALVDTGSQKSYILRKTALKMGYSSLRKETISHSLFGGVTTQRKEHEVYRVRVGDLNDEFRCNFEALDQEVICGDISHVTEGEWMNELKKLKIDITDNETSLGPIEILIGADVAGKLLTGRRELLSCGLVAVETLLGWTLMGKIPDSKRSEENEGLLVTSMFIKEASITALWRLDVIGISDPVENVSKKEREIAAKDHFLQSVLRTEEGRYQVRLPWTQGHPVLPSNLNLAERRLGSLKKKLSEDLFQDYNEVFEDWLADGIIEEVPESERIHCCHYLPHRPVVKENSATTRIRPVFDASAKLGGSPSLNQCLETGPNLIELIPNILLRFREKKIGVVADIKRAFLQISIHPEDRNFLCFLWWKNHEKMEVRVFRHARVVFGVKCSPFLLGAVIEHHLLTEEDSNHSLVKEKLLNSFYVDNVVASVDTEAELNVFISESVKVMAEAKFELRGWEWSNEKCQSTHENSYSVVLGLLWNRDSDELKVNMSWIRDFHFDTITKRTILSISHKVFDPIGFSCPVMLCPKLLLQKVWKMELDWDTEVDDTIKKEFRLWYEELPQLGKIGIPRWVQKSVNMEECSLHIFCDASQKAYAAVVFLRVETSNNVQLHLLAAKTRVSPIKKISMPCLELMAATIGARLAKSVLDGLGWENVKTFYWSDSTTVIAWITRGDKWTVFVRNRVNEIRKLTYSEAWKYVPGELNPADLPSRGCKTEQLVASRWWEGPAWLKETPGKWFAGNGCPKEVEINMEKVRSTAVMNVNCLVSENQKDWYFKYFSNSVRIVRMLGWLLRFISNSRLPKDRRQKRELTVEEYATAERRVVQFIQEDSFSGLRDDRLRTLRVFQDSEGIIRLKTKITYRDDHEDFCQPAVLPSQHEVVKRLIMTEHKMQGHVGLQMLLNILRERYWILNGRKTIRSVLSKCVICKRHSERHLVAVSPPLPTSRVRDAAVFEIVGLDLTGPLYLQGGIKMWVCLFTCAVFRAVHLELVSSVSTEAFLQALRRFVARRGRCSVIYSDNGTNFTGASNLLRNLNWEDITKYCTARRIEWRFNPPGAPWWGGWWERLIRLLKDLLKRILGRSCLTHEEMMTTLCDCESLMNSRPLTYIMEEGSELVPLSPSLFLQDIREIGVPDLDAIDGQSLKKRFRYRQTLKRDLRKRFRSEYLGQLVLHREKEGTHTVAVGDVVLIGCDNLKRIDWPLGYVIEVIPGKDGVIRTVKLKTGQGELLRPIQRIYPLEVSSDDPIVPSGNGDPLSVQKEDNNGDPVVTRSGRTITLQSRSCHQGRVIWRRCQQICAVSRSSMCGNIAQCHHSRLRLFHCTATTNEEAKIVTVPSFAESVSEGDVRWEKSVGDHVAEDEVVAEIETDKTSVPVTSPSAGIVEEHFVEDGATVKPGDKLFKIKIADTGAADMKHEPASATALAPSAPLTVPTKSKLTTSRLESAPTTQSTTTAPSSTAQIPMTSIPVAAIRHAQALEAASLKVPPSDPTKEITGTRSEVRVKMNRMRQRIAQRLKEAQNTNAMLTTFNEVDMGNIMEFRKTHKDAFLKKYNIKMGFMSAFVKASAYALQDQPILNAVIADTDIIYRDYVDISVAVATPKGLVVPVLRNVESMNFADIEINIAALSEKARKGHLALEDMDGGTFTVSNGGVFGSLMGTPIINPPQSAILGMHGILERPIAVNGQVVVRPMMYIALTYDHRLVDGREAVLFLRKIKAAIEDPRIMFLGL